MSSPNVMSASSRRYTRTPVRRSTAEPTIASRSSGDPASTRVPRSDAGLVALDGRLMRAPAQCALSQRLIVN